MKKTCRNFLFTAFLLAIFSALPALCNAQGDPGDDPDAPIDGGVSILVAAGVGYGLKKANDQRKKNRRIDVNDKNNP